MRRKILGTAQTSRKNETEQNVRENVKTIDNGLKMFDNTLNQQMEEGFVVFHQAYNDSGGDPSRMDLIRRLKQQLGGKMYLDIINSSGVVEYTTFSSEFSRGSIRMNSLRGPGSDWQSCRG